MPRIYVKTLGCKVNTYDGQALAGQFLARGYELAKDAGEADVAIVNTCSVTANADREARSLARRLRRANPAAVVIYTGCYAQTDSAKLAAMDEIDFVVPNQAKDQVLGIAEKALHRRQDRDQAALRPLPVDKLPQGLDVVSANRQSSFKSATTFFEALPEGDRTRVFLKIQDGCNGFCAYCLIPYARGASRSVPHHQVVAEVERLAARGLPELVLTGIHIGDYGREDEEAESGEPIAALIDAIMAIPGVGRLRISSLEPAEVSAPLLAVLAKHQTRICRHFHLPLQSGSDPVLKRMRRCYDSSGYAAAVAKLRQIFPDASIGADVIPGFPGESDDDHAATMSLIKDLHLSYLHVFPYSRRPNTAADRMPGHVHGELIQARAAALRKMSDNAARDYACRFVGAELAVVWEQKLDGAGRRTGVTDNYLEVVASRHSRELVAGCTTRARIKGFAGETALLALPC